MFEGCSDINPIAKDLNMNSPEHSYQFTSGLFITDLAQKQLDRWRSLAERESPLVETQQLPDTRFKRVVGDRILLEHRFHQIANEVPETPTVKAGLVINLGRQYELDRWIDGKFHHDRIQTGDFTVFPADISYGVAWDRSIEVLMVGFDPALIQQTVLELNDYNRRKLVANCDLEIFPKDKLNDPLIYQISLALKHELNTNGSVDRLYTESLTDTLLVHLLRYCSSQPFDRSLLDRGLANSQLQEIVDYIYENIAYDLSLSELATIAGMGVHHFGNLFKRSTGLSPYQYVIQQRLDRAKELLKDRDLSIVDIAIQTGFANQSHLTRLFSKHLAITPKKYRELL
jgi:AraC family transcriptional regulator